jgi:hypothetical protein
MGFLNGKKFAVKPEHKRRKPGGKNKTVTVRRHIVTRKRDA